MRVMFLCLIFAARLMPAADEAVIVNSGSTNSPGFRIVVERSGKAVYSPSPRRSAEGLSVQAKHRSRKITHDLARRFYSDLDAAAPLADLPKPACMKSASFGTTLTVELAAQKSPDLSCGDGGNAKLKALIQDTDEIVKIFR